MGTDSRFRVDWRIHRPKADDAAFLRSSQVANVSR